MANKKVMIVDNDKDFLSELRETLALSGYDLIAVDDPEQTLDLAEREQVDCIMLDLRMPKKNGFELAYEISHSALLHDVPIIAMTGFYKDDYAPLLETCGVRHCLKKPFRPLDVISVIETMLHQQSKNWKTGTRINQPAT